MSYPEGVRVLATVEPLHEVQMPTLPPASYFVLDGADASSRYTADDVRAMLAAETERCCRLIAVHAGNNRASHRDVALLTISAIRSGDDFQGTVDSLLPDVKPPVSGAPAPVGLLAGEAGPVAAALEVPHIPSATHFVIDGDTPSARYTADEVRAYADSRVAELVAALERLVAVYSASHSPAQRAAVWHDTHALIAKHRKDQEA